MSVTAVQVEDCFGALQTAPGDPFELSAAPGERTIHVIGGESGQPGEHA